MRQDCSSGFKKNAARDSRKKTRQQRGKRRSEKAIALLAAASAVALLSSQQSASAQNFTWTGNAGSPTDTVWGDPANWGGTAPATTDTADNLIFTGSYTGTAATLYNAKYPTTTSNLLSSVSSIVFASGAGAFTLTAPVTGTALTVGAAGITNNSSNLQIIGEYVAIAPGVTTTFNAGTAGLSLSAFLLLGSTGGGSTLSIAGSAGFTAASRFYLYDSSIVTSMASSTTIACLSSGQIGSGTNSITNDGGKFVDNYVSFLSTGATLVVNSNDSSATTTLYAAGGAVAIPAGSSMTFGGSAGKISIASADGTNVVLGSSGVAAGQFLKQGTSNVLLGLGSGTTTGIDVTGGTLGFTNYSATFSGNTTIATGGTVGLQGAGSGYTTTSPLVGYLGSVSNVVSFTGGALAGLLGTNPNAIANSLEVDTTGTITGIDGVSILGTVVGGGTQLTFDASEATTSKIFALDGTVANTFAGVTQFLGSANSANTGSKLVLIDTGGVAVAGNLQIDGNAASNGVSLGASNQIAAASSVTINSGYLNFNGFTNSLSSVTMTGGVLSLPGASSILGGTSLVIGDNSAHSATTLDISGNTLAGGYVLSSGQSLSGNGIVLTGTSTNPLILASGATLHPGDAPGLITFGSTAANGNLSIAPNANLVFDLSGPNSNSALAAVSGLLNFGGLSSSKVNLSLSNVTLPASGNSATYELFTYGNYTGDTGTGGDITNDFSILINGSAPSGTTTADVTEGVVGGNQIDVVVSSVPEPASVSLLGLGALGLLGRRRKRLQGKKD